MWGHSFLWGTSPTTWDMARRTLLPATRQRALIELHQGPPVRLRRVLRCGALFGGSRDSLAQFVIGKNAQNRPRHRIRTARLDHQSGHVLLQNLRYAANLIGHNRQSSRHRFEYHIGGSLTVGWHGNDSRQRVIRSRVPLKPCKLMASPSQLPPQDFVRAFPLRAIANNHDPKRRRSGIPQDLRKHESDPHGLSRAKAAPPRESRLRDSAMPRSRRTRSTSSGQGDTNGLTALCRIADPVVAHTEAGNRFAKGWQTVTTRYAPRKRPAVQPRIHAIQRTSLGVAMIPCHPRILPLQSEQVAPGNAT